MKVKYLALLASTSMLTVGVATTTLISPPTHANPCAATAVDNPCAAKDPCAAKNPCAAKDPCAAKKTGESY